MATIIRDDQIDKVLDRQRGKRRPLVSRAALAGELLRAALGIPAKSNGKPRRSRKE